MVKIVKSTIQALANVTKGLSSRGVLRALVKSVAIQLVISLSLFADSNPLDGFNVIVKDLVVAGKTKPKDITDLKEIAEIIYCFQLKNN